MTRDVPSSAWTSLGDYLRETQLIGSIQSTLYWDQNTRMPSGGAAWRGEQLALLARQLHARQSCERYEALIGEARQAWQASSEQTSEAERLAQARNLDLLEQELHRQQALDPDLVSAIAVAKSEGYECWQQAKAASAFDQFAPSLKRMVALRQEQARQLAEPRSCWETLAQPFEPDLTLARLQELFAPLRQRLPELLGQLQGGPRPTALSWDLEAATQQDLCDQLLKCWGRDESITCVAASPHPFSITLGPRDFRITTRVVAGQPLSCFLATAHEWGHSLYEQGLPPSSHQWFAWPLGQATSMAVHESQSLFWENRVARSQPFAEHWWPRFAAAGAPIANAIDLWRAMNPMAPGCNRVEADELSYGLHILIRTDLELALLEQGLEVEALPSEWNRRYGELLGVTPADDAEGCLQDVHWSEGLFGYFPSYLLGHLISAQISEAMEMAVGAPEEHVRRDDLQPVLSWLREAVHPIGRALNAEQLVASVTGRPLSSEPFLRYLESKIERLLALS
ncbi:carboxypeptidase M32 [Synechococcus sp. BMK-MC-1]|uniref:carboxypeptidase M32 n=1 Tax=Synechococcus sp. BMK-MC-1 TaxID=1442551 RepID=UPI0016463E9F|nr:carboxypeptidase M32 [Synechococcus sp. BMK-MC-1]QNI68202.1 carboxypeptidase Taq (M32) metallopeptidase [Synechococcus sp. BMK-MC-1]